MTTGAIAETVTERRAYSVIELARAYTLSVGFLRGEIRRNALPVHRLGRRVLVLTEDWDSYLRASREGRRNVGGATEVGWPTTGAAA